MWRYMNDSYWCIDTGWNRNRDQEHFTLHPTKPRRRPGPDVNPLLWSRSLSRFHWVWINQQCWLYNVLTSRRAAASAPCFNSSLTHSTWLFAAAKTRGVVPSWNRSELITFSVLRQLEFYCITKMVATLKYHILHCVASSIQIREINIIGILSC